MHLHMQTVPVEIPEGANIILGQTHFIKTVEDLYEILAAAIPHARFGIAFNEASGPCLIRTEGNDPELTAACAATMAAIAAGHVFCILLQDAFPIAVLNQIKNCPEVCRIYCATANPLQVVVACTDQGRGIMGVIDGASPKGMESDADRQSRHALLRTFGYKR